MWHMGQSGRVAYLSNRTMFAPGDPWLAPMEAEREARRILGETEPDEPGTASFCIERLQGAGRVDGAGRVYGFPGTYALAESLAAVLPVLDELEAEARQ